MDTGGGGWVGKGNNEPTNLYIIICGTCEYVTLHLKMDFTDVIKVKTDGEIKLNIVN